MSMDLIMLYLDEMPKIDAQEHLQMVTVYALGSGSLKKEDSNRVMRDLQRRAYGTQKAPPATPEALEAMGIAIKKEKKKR